MEEQMDYFFISLITVIVVFTFMYKVNKLNNLFDEVEIPEPKLTQSALFSERKTSKKKPVKTQSIEFMENKLSRILFTENQAYWISDNAVYKANVVRNEIDKNTIEKVDIMTMDKVELDKMIFIIDKLTERS